MNRVLALLAALTLTLTAAISAATNANARPDAKTYTITVQWDRDVPSYWPRSAPDVWENGTRLNFVRGTCSGPYCIKVHTDAAGTACSATAVGCAGDLTSATFPDLRLTTCHVWLYGWFDRSYSKAAHLSNVAHEVGHCLGLPHSDDPYSIMWPQLQAYQPTMTPSAGDLANLNALWP